MSYLTRALFEHRLLQHPAHQQAFKQQPIHRCLNRIQQQRLPTRSLQRRFQTTVSDQPYAQPPPPPRRFRPLRILFYGIYGTTLIFTGMLLGFYAFPDRPDLEALKGSLSHKPSDAETLDLYEPPDEQSTCINQHILSHPVVAALRNHPGFTESRPHLKIPPILRHTNLTGGTLAGPGRIVVPPLQFAHDKGESLTSVFYLGPHLCGHPGIIHGGLLATLLDEGLARCCFPALPNGVGVTANLKIDYRKPVKAEKYYVLRAETYRLEGRKAWVRGWIEELGEAEGVSGREEEGMEGKGRGRKLVEAEGLFVEPRNAQFIKKYYQP